jgi:hypothetical protein
MNKAIYFQKQLEVLNPEYPFSADDFNISPEYRKTLLKFLQNEYKKGNIGRLEKGLYYKPRIAFVTGNKLPPSSYSIYEYLKKKDIGYLTGPSVHNGLSFNTQICGAIIYASNKKPRDFKLKNIRFVRIKAFVPDEDIVEKNLYLLQILDSINEIETISDCLPDDAVCVLKGHLKKMTGQQIIDMERLSQYYSEKVQALLGAMLGSIRSENRQTAKQASERLRKRLPANRKYKFPHLTDQELHNRKKFNIYETA